MKKQKYIDLCENYMRNRYGYIRTYGAMRVMLTPHTQEAVEFAEFLRQYSQYKVLKISNKTDLAKVFYKKE